MGEQPRARIALSLRHPRRKGCRRGTTTVEFALIAIPLFLFIFTGIEFGRALMAKNSLEEAARSGCRVAILEGATYDEVTMAVAETLGPVGITNYTVTVEPDPPGSAAQWDHVSVSIQASYDDISWLPTPVFLRGHTVSASSTFAREADTDD